ncbi:hypothetical protein [Paraburkholderia terricola]|uniref:hypothetical protein n=1 Tax=Paraburkholderia terricola TaxID=169427 RepID=UPI003ECFB9A5
MPTFSFFIVAGTILSAATYVAKKQDELFKAYRDTQTKRDKKRLSNLLEQFSFLAAFGGALESFGSFSDTFFGRKLLSWRSLRRSALVSLCCFAFFCSASLYINAARGSLHLSVFRPALVATFLMLLVACVAIDYVSVCATRWLIRLANERTGVFKSLIFVVDFLLSALIFTFLFTPAKLIISGVASSELAVWMREPLTFIWSEIQPWWHLAELPMLLRVTHDVHFSLGPDGKTVPMEPIQTVVSYIYPESAAFLSSMLTSMWLWLYLSAWLATAFTARLDIVKRFAVRHATVKADPIAVLNFWLQLIVFAIAIVLVAALAFVEYVI